MSLTTAVKAHKGNAFFFALSEACILSGSESELRQKMTITGLRTALKKKSSDPYSADRTIPPKLNARLKPSVEKIQRVASVVDEIDGAMYVGQAEQCTGSRRCAGVIEKYLRDLSAVRRRFHQESVVSVYGQDGAAIADGKPEGIVQAPTLGNCGSGSCRCVAHDRMPNGRNAIVHAIGDVESVGVAIEPHTCRTDHQSGRIGALGESRTDDRHRLQPRHGTGRNDQRQPQHGSLVHYRSIRSNRSVENIRDEQLSEVARVPCSHIPGPVNQGTEERFDHRALIIQHEQAAGLGGSRGSVTGREAAHDNPSAAQNN